MEPSGRSRGSRRMAAGVEMATRSPSGSCRTGSAPARSAWRGSSSSCSASRAALLPAGKTISSDMIGGLLIAAGLIETVAGSLRHGTRQFVMAAGVVTALAGLLFIMNPETHLFPTRVADHRLASAPQPDPRRRDDRDSPARCGCGPAFSAGMDFLLAVLLIAGLSHGSTLVVSVFGPTRELIATFAWILAASFAVNGLMLLQVANCAEDARTSRRRARRCIAPRMFESLARPFGQHRRGDRPARARAGVPAERHRRLPQRPRLAAFADRRPLARDRADGPRQPRPRA